MLTFLPNHTYLDDIIQNLKTKLAYVWKNIYRSLFLEEEPPRGSGVIQFKRFESVLSKHRVFLSREELSNIMKLFEEKGLGDSINYCKMSKALGLHNNALELIRPTTQI
jgi:hypothetical protein